MLSWLLVAVNLSLFLSIHFAMLLDATVTSLYPIDFSSIVITSAIKNAIPQLVY